MTDFRNETIYFIVVDRFNDGDPANNTGKDNDYDPTRQDWWKYWGGDLQGIIDRLDYIQGLGATALWLTPLFDQVDGVIAAGGQKMAPYHGYWAKDFQRIDEHLVEHPDDVRVFAGKETVFDRLVRELHRRGMKLILDIVCNHSSPHVGGGRSELYDDGQLIASYDGDHGGWYHHLGGVENWEDLGEVQSRDLSGLADFNEESYPFRVYIKDALRRWLDKGVDGFRVDTVKHMPLWFWQEFTGDMVVHRPDLFMFGEWFQGGCYDPASIEFAGKSGMSILDFAWRNAVVSALASCSDRGFREIADVVGRDHLFRDASELVTFVDNHDLPRFLSISYDPDRFRLALLLTMVVRGIPCLFYGGEQRLHCDENGGNDPYNRPMMTSFDPTPLCRDIAVLASLRRCTAAIQKGGMREKWLDADRYAFTRQYGDSACLVAANRLDEPASLLLGAVELPDGTYSELLGGPEIQVLSGGTTVQIPPRGIVVYSHNVEIPAGHKVLVDMQVFGLDTAYGQEVYVCGDAPELGRWDVDRAVPLEYINRSSWATTTAFHASAEQEIHYKYLIRQGGRFQREPGRGHHRRVPKAGRAIWRDDWRL